MNSYIGTDEKFRAFTDEATFARISADETVSKMWQRCACAYADKTALVHAGSSVTFAELDERVSAFRGALSAKGVKPLTRLALLSRNSIDFAVMFLGAVTLGCAVIVLPPHLGEKEVAGVCKMFGASALIAEAALKEKCVLAPALNPGIILLTSDETGEKDVPAFESGAEDECVIMFTGGTTGKSKGAVLTHAAVMQGTVNGCYGVRDVFEQKYILILPLSHVFGLIRNLLYCIFTGSALFISASPQNLFKDIAAFRPTALVMVPALAEMALQLSKKLGRNMLGDSVKYIICGAAAVPQFLVEEYDKIGITLFPGYGLTESANLVSGNPVPLKKPGSVGIPYPNQQLKIVDGELWLRGKNMLKGYVGTDEVAWTEDGWFRTGDLVTMDEDGFLYITGRIKEIIVLDNAENISPAALEERFNALPFVQDSQVFEAVGDNGKHILALEVVLRASEIASLGENPKAKAEEALWQINNAQRPAERVSKITIRDTDFARSPSMKIIRYKQV